MQLMRAWLQSLNFPACLLLLLSAATTTDKYYCPTPALLAAEQGLLPDCVLLPARKG